MSHRKWNGKALQKTVTGMGRSCGSCERRVAALVSIAKHEWQEELLHSLLYPLRYMELASCSSDAAYIRVMYGKCTEQVIRIRTRQVVADDGAITRSCITSRELLNNTK